jgi:hypothetical protein
MLAWRIKFGKSTNGENVNDRAWNTWKRMPTGFSTASSPVVKGLGMGVGERVRVQVGVQAPPHLKTKMICLTRRTWRRWMTGTPWLVIYVDRMVLGPAPPPCPHHPLTTAIKDPQPGVQVPVRPRVSLPMGQGRGLGPEPTLPVGQKNEKANESNTKLSRSYSSQWKMQFRAHVTNIKVISVSNVFRTCFRLTRILNMQQISLKLLSRISLERTQF